MPLNNEDLPTDLRQEFCLALKTARERKGITLDEIARATKIPAYLFAGLERSDLRRWPKGLFRRSFFRDYARTAGLPVDDLCAEFARLFPDNGSAKVATPAAFANEAGQECDLRLALDPEWHGLQASILVKAVAASIDAAIVILVALAIAWVTGVDRTTATALVALAYFSLATAILGESPAKWAITNRGAIVRMFAPAENEATPEPAHDEPEVHQWISDARRVGPPSGLSVRIKVS